MPAHILSEIDAIFATNSSSSSSLKTKKPAPPLEAHTSIASGSAQVEGSGSTDRNNKSSRRKSSSKRKSGGKLKDDGLGVEEVLDPSQAILKSSSIAAQKKRKVVLDEEELAFRDSRGTRSKTDDGLPIYSVEELKIGLGGDTPACPFDCDCCF